MYNNIHPIAANNYFISIILFSSHVPEHALCRNFLILSNFQRFGTLLIPLFPVLYGTHCSHESSRWSWYCKDILCIWHFCLYRKIHVRLILDPGKISALYSINISSIYLSLDAEVISVIKTEIGLWALLCKWLCCSTLISMELCKTEQDNNLKITPRTKGPIWLPMPN